MADSQPTYSDLPEGAVIVQHGDIPMASEPAAQPSYSDLPPGAVLVSAPDASSLHPESGGLPPAKSRQEFEAGLHQLTQQRAPANDIRLYTAASGFQPHPDTQKWLDSGGYDKYLKDHPDSPGITWKATGPQPDVNEVTATWRGLQHNALGGFDDEIAGLGGAALNKIGLNRIVGPDGKEADLPFWDAYDQFRRAQQNDVTNAYNQHPGAYDVGAVGGALMQAPLLAGKAAPAATLTGRVLDSAVMGAKAGAVRGAGDSEEGVANRIIGAGEGAAEGGGAGALSHPIGVAANYFARPLENFIGQQAARVRGAMGGVEAPSGQTMGALDRLGNRAPQDEAAMRARQQSFQQSGVPVRPLDVVDTRGQRVIGAASRQPEAADISSAHAADVNAAAPERVTDQARAHISDSPMTANQVAATVTAEQKALGPKFDAVRGNPVTLTPEAMQVFTTQAGRSALRAMGADMGPNESNALREFIGGIQRAGKDVPLPGFGRDIAAGDMPKLQAAIQAALGKEGVPPAAFTVDMADKFARILNRVADQPKTLNPSSLRDMARVVRGAARVQHPGYGAALDEVSGNARVGDAATGTGKFENTDYLTTPPDQYAPNIRQASDTPAIGVTRPSGRTSVEEGADGFHRATYRAQDGQTVTGIFRLSPDGKTMKVGTVGSGAAAVGGRPNSIGAADMRQFMQDLKLQYPNVESFVGDRVSGAGAGRAQAVAAPEVTPGISEADALRMRARDQVVNRVNESPNVSTAVGVARQLSNAPNQQARNAALLGGRNAQALEQSMGNEATRVENTANYIDNGTHADASDDPIVSGVKAAVSHASGGKFGMARAAAAVFRRGGIRGVNAERLVRMAISEDPAQVEQAISYLGQRGIERQRAQSIIQAMTAGGAASRIASTPNPELPPLNSVRAIVRQPSTSPKGAFGQ